MKHLEPSVHAPFRLKAGSVAVNESSSPSQAVAPLRRRSAGAFMPKIRRRDYAGDSLAPLRRRSGGAITPATHWLHHAGDSQQPTR